MKLGNQFDLAGNELDCSVLQTTILLRSNAPKRWAMEGQLKYERRESGLQEADDDGLVPVRGRMAIDGDVDRLWYRRRANLLS